MNTASMGTRVFLGLCGLWLAAASVTAQQTLQGLQFVPRFSRLLRQDLGSIASYLVPTEQPLLCAAQCCQADSYASPYVMLYTNSTQQNYGGRTYTTFSFVFHANHSCNSQLDLAGCCTASAHTVWVDVDPTLKVKYVSYMGQRLAYTEQNQYGLKLGSLNLSVTQAKTGVSVAITVDGAADSLCPPPGLVPVTGLCEIIVQGGNVTNPDACCPTTVSIAANMQPGPVPTPITPVFQCDASLYNSPFKLAFDSVAQIGSGSLAQFLVYNFRLVSTNSCRVADVSDCCNAQLAFLELKVTNLAITGVQLGGISRNYTSSLWNEPNSASYRSLIVDNLNHVENDLREDGVPLTVTVRIPLGSDAERTDLCDASSDPHQGACSYFLHSEDGFCCPSGLVLPTDGVPPPPPGTCSPSENVPPADTSMSLQFYERFTVPATTTFAFLLANHNPSGGCNKHFCVDICSWTLYLNDDVAAQLTVRHDDPANNGRHIISTASTNSLASLTFTYGPAGESTNTFYVNLPAGGKFLTDLCARDALPGQGTHACAAVVRSTSVYMMVFFDESDIIILPGAQSPPLPVEPMCSEPRPMSDSCLVSSSARYNTMLSTAVFDFTLSPVTATAACQTPTAPSDLTTVHILLTPTTVDQLTTRMQVRPSTGLVLNPNDGARWQVSPTAATSLSFQVQGLLSMGDVCRQDVAPDQPAATCVVEVSSDMGCFRGYVAGTADGRLIWVDQEDSPKKGVAAGIIVPAVVAPLIALLVTTAVVVAWYRRRRGQQYFFMNSGSDDLDRPLATHSINSLGEMSSQSASMSSVHIRVPGASQGGVGPAVQR